MAGPKPAALPLGHTPIINLVIAYIYRKKVLLSISLQIVYRLIIFTINELFELFVGL
jgi:hypothetical protein